MPLCAWLAEIFQVKLPFIERIWNVEGSLDLNPPLTSAEAFERLNPLLQAAGTTYDIDGDTLTYSKDNPAAQDKMASFTKGTLQVAGGQGGSKLVYRLKSPALLMCFLAPLLFLAIAQFMILINNMDGTGADARSDAAAEEEEEEDKEVQPLHPLDVFLGAPAPEQPGEDESEEEEKEKDEGHSTTPAYVLAALFAFLYGVGRVLEPWLIRRHFLRALYGPPDPDLVEASEVQGSA